MNKNWLLLIGGIVLVIAIFFGLSNKPPKVSAFDEKREALLDSLELPDEASIIKLTEELSKDRKNITLLDTLSHIWFHAGYPDIAADYDRQIADHSLKTEDYLRAGKSFFDALPSDTSQTIQINMVYGARYCYEKVLEQDSTHLEARIGLAKVFVQGTNEPMKGIGILRALDAEFPENAEVNMELGQFSMMSGQYEKAIERFLTVLQKDSLNLQAQFLLAESYMAIGDTLQSVKVLEKTIGLTGDPLLDAQVRQYIQSITN